jgi:hypothetical protein
MLAYAETLMPTGARLGPACLSAREDENRTDGSGQQQDSGTSIRDGGDASVSISMRVMVMAAEFIAVAPGAFLVAVQAPVPFSKRECRNI